MNDQTFFIKIKKRSLLTNLRHNQTYSKQRLISEFQDIIDEIKKQPDEFYLVSFKTTPALGLEITTYSNL